MERRMSGRAERGAQKRTGILAAAARAIATQGYHGMSMRDLARATGRGLASFYNYFPSKEELLFAIQAEAFERLVAASVQALEKETEPAARLHAFILTHVRYFAEHPDVMRVLIAEAAALPPERRRTIRGLKQKYFRIGEEVVRAVMRQGCGRPAGRGAGARALHPAEVERATYCVFGMLNWIYGWYEPARHGTPADLARTIHRIALCGLVSECPYGPLQSEVEGRLLPIAAPPLLGRASGGAA